MSGSKHVDRWMAFLRLLISGAAFALLAGCAALMPASYGFEFRPLADNPDIKVLDWRYGGLVPYAWELDLAEKGERGLQGASVYGSMPVPERMYVKWQVPPNPEVFERYIDLKGKLPHSMRDREVVVLFRANEPYIYLVTRVPRSCEGESCVAYLQSDNPRRRRIFLHGVIKQIYPNFPGVSDVSEFRSLMGQALGRT